MIVASVVGAAILILVILGAVFVLYRKQHRQSLNIKSTVDQTSGKKAKLDNNGVVAYNSDGSDKVAIGGFRKSVALVNEGYSNWERDITYFNYYLRTWLLSDIEMIIQSSLNNKWIENNSCED